MKFKGKITQLAIAGAVSSVLISGLTLSVIATPKTRAAVSKIAQALSPEEVNLRAKQIIVRIDGASVGSGSIIEYSDNTYTVLSNWHVMKNQGSYTVQTIDGRKHEVIPSSIQQLAGLDLAVLKFTSNQNYQTAELGDSSNLTEGQNVYFAGYPGELRREDNRYYRFFTANLVGILPKSTENGYSLVYNGEAFPGMSGGPVFNREGLVVGVHGEANVHALSGGTSNYAIPIASYQQAIANLNSSPVANPTPSPNPEVVVPQPVAQEPEPAPEPEPEPEPEANQQPELPDSGNISSVPTFAAEPEPEPESEPEVEPETKQPEVVEQPQVEVEEVEVQVEEETQEEVYVPTTTRKIALVSPKTGIDYTKLRNLLKEGKWSEADLHTYRLVEQIIKSAKQQNKHIFIELKTIAEYSCPDIRTVDYLWKKYSDDQFGFSQQQEVWQNVNQKGDFSTETWRRFATKVGWKEGEVASSSGYLLYDQLNFEPTVAPAGHLPWWFALSEEEQKVMKYLFARCNLNPTLAELEAEAKKNSPNTAQNPGINNRGGNNSQNNQPEVNKPPKSPNN